MKASGIYKCIKYQDVHLLQRKRKENVAIQAWTRHQSCQKADSVFLDAAFQWEKHMRVRSRPLDRWWNISPMDNTTSKRTESAYCDLSQTLSRSLNITGILCRVVKYNTVFQNNYYLQAIKYHPNISFSFLISWNILHLKVYSAFLRHKPIMNFMLN